MEFQLLNENELETVDGGSVWKYIGAVAAIGFGLYEISTGVGAADGMKNVITGGCTVVGGILVFIS